MLDIRQDHRLPAMERTADAVEGGSGQKRPVLLMVVVKGQSHLLEIVRGLRRRAAERPPPSAFTRGSGALISQPIWCAMPPAANPATNMSTTPAISQPVHRHRQRRSRTALASSGCLENQARKR